MVKVDRSALLFYVFTFLTLGFYSFYFLAKLGQDVNIVCAEDNKKQMSFWWALFLGLLTFGIVLIVWELILINRVYDHAENNRIAKSGSFASYILGTILGSITVIIPIIVFCNFINTVNNVCTDYVNKADESLGFAE